MNIPDVNVWIGALRTDSSHHQYARRWLDRATAGTEPLGLSEPIAYGVVRILTNPRIFAEPNNAGEVLTALDKVRRHPLVIPVRPGVRHWAVFGKMCRAGDLAGNDIADAYHAALAVEHDATFVTFDRGFARFDGLRWFDPSRPG